MWPKNTKTNFVLNKVSTQEKKRVDLFDYVPEEDKSVVLEAINEYREDADFGLD